MTPPTLDTRVAVLEHADVTKDAMLRAGAQSMGETRQVVTDVRDLAMATKRDVDALRDTVKPLQDAAKPVPWWAKGGVVWLVGFVATLVIGWIKVPTREDQEKAVAALVAVDAAIRARAEELALRNERLAGELKTLGAQLDATQRELAAMRDRLRR